MRIHVWLVGLLSLAQAGLGQGPTVEAAKELAKQGAALKTDVMVEGNVSVEAVLLPPSVTRGLFGRAVSDRYVAVQLIVSNRSDSAALIVHSLFLDYSRWLLSSASAAEQIPDCARPGVDPKQTLPACVNRTEEWQAATRPSQIASTEYRLPRGQLLHAQPWTARNIAIRAAEIAGTIAAGYVFALSEPGFAKGVAAYNGNFLPGLRAFLPDGSIEQANRISDLGFRINKVIPQQSSDVVVAFFPTDRFLTPGLRKLFDKAPAIFFVPEAAALDPVARKELFKAIPELAKSDEWAKNLVEAVKQGRQNKTTEMFDRLSMNRIRVVVGGAMSVDARLVPASIDDVVFDDTDRAMFWLETGTKTGTIQGRFLSGGKAVIVNADALPIGSVATITAGSSSESLRFSFALNGPLPPNTKFAFRVDKETDKQGVQGPVREETVPSVMLTTPEIDTAVVADDTLTITGKRFFTTPENPLKVSLLAGSTTVPVPLGQNARTPTSITADLKRVTEKLTPACWMARVDVGTMFTEARQKFPKAPTPTITEAKKNGNRIIVTGLQFVDLKECGVPLKFEIAEQAASSVFKAVTGLTPASDKPDKQVSFDLPQTPANGKFKVRVVVGATEANTANVTE